MSEALEFLNKLTDRGIEWADAVYHTSVKFNLNSEQVSELELEYDNQFVGGQE